MSSAAGASEGTRKESTSSYPTPDNRFDNLFPSYSQSMFSGLLEGDLLDEELNALFSFNVDHSTTTATGEGAAHEDAQHPGLLVACTAAALDANPVLGEPYYFCVNSGSTAPSPAESSQNRRPVSTMHTDSVAVQSNISTQKTASELLKATSMGQKRALSVLDNMSSTTKNMLKKAKGISFQSSCGPLSMLEPKFEMMPQKTRQNPTNCNPDETTLAPLQLPQPDAFSFDSSSCRGSGPMSNESVSIVDALIQTLSSQTHNPSVPASAPTAFAGVSSSSSSAVPSDSLNSDSITITSGASEANVESPPAPKQATPPAPVAMGDPAVAAVVPGAPWTANFETAAPLETTDWMAFLQRPLQETRGSASSVTSTMDSVQSNPAASITEMRPAKGGRRQICTELQEIPKEMRTRMRNLAPEMRNELSKDRNRIHARNTRIRKKAYVDDLKKAVNDLVDEREAAEALQERQAKIRKQNRDVRFLVMQHYLKLQATAEEATAQLWHTLLTDNIVVSFPSFTTGVAATTVTGVEEVICHSKNFCKSLKQSCGDPDLVISFDCDRKSFLMDGATAVLEVSMKVQSPSAPERAELLFLGCLRSSFCVQTNKIKWSRLLVDFGGSAIKQGTS